MDLRLLDLVAGILTATLVIGILFRRRRVQLPPGPRGMPIVGNIYDVPKSFEWLEYQKWSREFDSDVIYLNLLGTSVVILNSRQAVDDLLEKKSSIYSDRMPMGIDLVGCDWNFALAKYNDSWRLRRKIFHRHFQPSVISKYRPRVLKGTREVLRYLLKEPDNFIAHFRHFVGALSIGIAYGLEVLLEDDPYISNIDRAMHITAKATRTGAYLVDSVPILKYVPAWFPGAGFKRQAAEWRKCEIAASELPLASVKKQMADGVAPPSILRSLLSDLDEGGDDAHLEKMFGSIGATTFAGENLSSFGSFVLAMLLYPDVQRKAQEDIDRVVGSDRLPDFSDQPSLPYVAAIVKEVMRWRPVLPLAVTHRLTEEDEYKGYRIPAGSLVIGNSWRLCPGRHMAFEIMWMTVASILAAFTLEKPLGEDGAVIEPGGEYDPGLLIFPKPFSCAFKLRSKAAED
ncbi:cytochrome P450 [Amylocystis lapponica]|nr:cytochrome P450 [Amylocystis lapponica]